MNSKEQLGFLIERHMRLDNILVEFQDKFISDDSKVESYADGAMGKLEQALHEIDTAINILKN